MPISKVAKERIRLTVAHTEPNPKERPDADGVIMPTGEADRTRIIANANAY